MKKVKSPISKEDLQRDIKREQNRRLIMTEFYPALVEATESVDEASMLLQAGASLIMQEAMEIMNAKKMKEVKGRLIKQLCPNDERLLQMEKLIGIFDGMSLFEARGHFESMKAVVEQMKIDEFRGRKLDTLKPDWERYLH